MPDASNLQSSFLGGEWSPFAQGRVDHPKYKEAMALCLNALPIEEGACPRRPGSNFIGTTLNGAQGRLLPFNFTDIAPYSIELTANNMRIVVGSGFVFTDDIASVVSFSNTTPAGVQFAAPVTWQDNDQIVLQFSEDSGTQIGAVLRNRVFSLTMLTASVATLSDPVTGQPVDGAQINWNGSLATVQAARILIIPTPYGSADWQDVRRVQAANVGLNNATVGLFLHGSYQPYALQATANAAQPSLASFTFGLAQFSDGPYLDPPNNVSMTPSGLSGSITLTIDYPVWSSTTAYGLGDLVYNGINVYESQIETNVGNTPASSPAAWQQVSSGAAVGPAGFQTTDIGRAVRLLSTPPEWVQGTPNNVGDNVTWQGIYYVCILASTGTTSPDVNPGHWSVSTSQTVFTWSWAIITSIISESEVQANVMGNPLLYTNTGSVSTFQMGAYSASTAYPTCGCYYEGRLWLAGAFPNRLDASNSDDFFNMAPTGPDGSVGDGNGISVTFDSDDDNEIYWLQPTASGLVAGTKSGEWLISASTLQDPITPSTIQAHRVTKVGCYNQIPCNTPLTTVFIHRYQRQLFEYFPDVFSGKMTAPNLNIFSKHLTTGLLEEIAYQAELAPIVWARMGDGSLAGWTYRRTSAFSNEDPTFVGAHRHQLGSGRAVESLVVNPSPDYTVDAAYLVTNDTTTQVRHIEALSHLQDSDAELWNYCYLDDSVAPAGLATGTVNGVSGVNVYGLWHLNGKTVTAFLGGLDCGDYTVTNGSIFVPYGSDPGQAFTLPYMQALAAGGNDFGAFAVPFDVITPPSGTPTSAPQTIMVYQYPQGNVTSNIANGIVDWINQVLYSFGESGTPGIRKWNIQTGVEIIDKTYPQIGSGLTDLAWPYLGAWDLGLDGNLYWMPADPTGTIIQVSAATLTQQSSFGVPQAVRDLRCCYVNGVQYIVGIFFNGSTNSQIMVFNAAGTQIGSAYTALTEIYGNLVVGLQNGSSGLVYVLTTPGGTGETSPSQLNLYTVGITSAPAATITHTATITPGQIDPTWTNFTQVAGPAVDPADGNLIVGFQSPSGPSQLCYMTKLNAATGAVIWRIAVSSIPFNGSIDRARIVNSTLAFLAHSTSTVYVINTATGSFSTFSVTGISDNDPQFFDSVTGQIILYLNSYSQTTGSPAPVSGTPTSFSNAFARLTAGDIFLGPGGSTTRITVPGCVGFTYTTQGQLLRALAPQEAGAANGPALGKTRRSHMFGMLLAGAITATIYVGTLFSNMRPLNFKSKKGTPYNTQTLFTGVSWAPLEDNYSFDGQLCWQVTRPLPANVTAFGGFLDTQDR